MMTEPNMRLFKDDSFYFKIMGLWAFLRYITVIYLFMYGFESTRAPDRSLYYSSLRDMNITMIAIGIPQVFDGNSLKIHLPQ